MSQKELELRRRALEACQCALGEVNLFANVLTLTQGSGLVELCYASAEPGKHKDDRQATLAHKKTQLKEAVETLRNGAERLRRGAAVRRAAIDSLVDLRPRSLLTTLRGGPARPLRFDDGLVLDTALTHLAQTRPFRHEAVQFQLRKGANAVSAARLDACSKHTDESSKAALALLSAGLFAHCKGEACAEARTNWPSAAPEAPLALLQIDEATVAVRVDSEHVLVISRQTSTQAVASAPSSAPLETALFGAATTLYDYGLRGGEAPQVLPHVVAFLRHALARDELVDILAEVEEAARPVAFSVKWLAYPCEAMRSVLLLQDFSSTPATLLEITVDGCANAHLCAPGLEALQTPLDASRRRPLVESISCFLKRNTKVNANA